MMPVVQKLLFALSGAQAEILEQCPTERTKFESLGWAILITSGMATASMWFALNSAMGLNPIVSLLGALVWGLIILGIDRWLVTSIPAYGSRRFSIAIPRIVLAVLLGTLISTPIVLRVFQSEIDAQITVIKQQRASAFLSQQQGSQVGKQVTYWRNDVANLQKVVDSGGEVPLNPSADPEVQSLTKQRNAEIGLEQRYYRQWQCQLYGGPGCPKGNGPLAQASGASYHGAVADVASLTRRIRLRENQLAATGTASKKARYQQASSALGGARQQLAAALARQDTLQQNFDAKNEATNGLLIRLQALNQLAGKDFTVNAVRFLLFLLFLVIECLPVTVKLLQRPGNYEAILQAAADREVSNAKRTYRLRPRIASEPDRTLTLPSAGAERFSGPDPSVYEVWRSTEEFAPGFSDTLETDSRRPGAGPDPGGPGGRSRGDDVALREMEDTRTRGDTSRRAGGIPLHYDDDAL